MSVSEDESHALVSTGLTIDGYLSSAPGWHVQAEVGLALYFPPAEPGEFDECGLGPENQGCAEIHGGHYAATGVGREYWLGPELGVGWLAHVTIMQGSRTNGTAPDTLPVFFALMGTLTYH